LIEYCLRLSLAVQQLLTMLNLLSSLFKTSAELRLENLVLRHQLGVLRGSVPRESSTRSSVGSTPSCHSYAKPPPNSIRASMSYREKKERLASAMSRLAYRKFLFQ
jgi:hypothetical protein